MNIFVKTLKGDRFEIQVNPEDLVADVKKNIETVLGVTASYPAAEKMLIHKGKVLKDETTVEANEVSEESVIVIMKAHATETTEPVWEDAATDVNYESISESNIQKILGMVRGAWSREMVADAIYLAYNGIDKALEYLYFGTQEQTQEPETPQDAVQEWSLDILRNTQEFEYLRVLVQSDPSFLQDILEMIKEKDPQLVQLILDNKADFLRLVLEQPQEELLDDDILNQTTEGIMPSEETEDGTTKDAQAKNPC